MAIAAFMVSLVAIGIAALSAYYTHRQVAVGERADLRERRPVLTFTLVELVSAPEGHARYIVQNHGNEDLDSVVIWKPETPDMVRYPVARLGGDFDDSADLGPLQMKAKQEFILAIGPGESLPEFQVRYRCTHGKDEWTGSEVLDDPRFHLNVF